MKTLNYTPQERLAMYRQAIRDYRKPGIDNYRKYGFCHYFEFARNTIGVFVLLDEIFPELCETRPGFLFGYWFKLGIKAPRIKCLQKAIEIIKKRYKIK